MIAPGLIIPYDGTNASIPSGFTRFAALNGKFPKATTGTTGSTGGASSHSHTGNTHTHTAKSHSHTANNTSSPQGYSTGFASGDDPKGGAGEGHTHSSNMSSATFSGSDLSDKVNFSSRTALPPYYDVIFIQADKYSQIPANGLIYRQTSRTGLTFHTASQNRFLRGAAAGSGAGSTGGSTTHTHPTNHTHTAVSHSHSGRTGNSGTSVREGYNGSFSGNHSHTYSVTQSLTGGAYTGTSGSGSSLPPYRNVGLYKASSQIIIEAGDICLCAGDVPTGWLLCDGTNGTPALNNLYIRNSSTAGTGGSLTHSHTGVAHSHSESHNHGGSATLSYHNGGTGEYGGSGKIIGNHTHSLTGISTVNMEWESATMTAQSATTQPPFYTVKYVMSQYGSSVVMVTINGSGTVSPEGEVIPVEYGQDQAVTATPSTGYYISSVKANDVAQTITDNQSFSYTFTNVTIPNYFEVTFSGNPVITATANTGGTITPAGETNVIYGCSQDYTITPNSGYYISDIKVDGASQTIADHHAFSYTFANVTTNHTIQAVFSPDPVITTTAGTGGSITPSNPSVVYGTSQTLTVTASDTYAIKSIAADGVEQTIINRDEQTYTFNNVIAAHTLTASFYRYSRVVSSTNSGGSISPSGTSYYNIGETPVYTVTANDGYRIVKVVVNGSEVDFGRNFYSFTYTFPSVTAYEVVNSIDVAFDILPVVTTSHDGGAVLDPWGNTSVPMEDDLTVKIKAKTGYHVSDVKVDGVSQGALSTYTFKDVITDHTLSVETVSGTPFIDLKKKTEAGCYYNQYDIILGRDTQFQLDESVENKVFAFRVQQDEIGTRDLTFQTSLNVVSRGNKTLSQINKDPWAYTYILFIKTGNTVRYFVIDEDNAWLLILLNCMC